MDTINGKVAALGFASTRTIDELRTVAARDLLPRASGSARRRLHAALERERRAATASAAVDHPCAGVPGVKVGDCGSGADRGEHARAVAGLLDVISDVTGRAGQRHRDQGVGGFDTFAGPEPAAIVQRRHGAAE
jgi:hypothetical protein